MMNHRKGMTDIALLAEKLALRLGSVQVVTDLSLDIRQGEFFAILGPSGSGKTTSLRLIAGLERPDSGELHFGQHLISSNSTFVTPQERKIGMVFQDYALFPHMTVLENIAYGVGGTRIGPAAWGKKKKGKSIFIAREYLDLVDLVGFEDRRISDLSGGEQQRVALARALAPQPNILLLDEPFSNLDPVLRVNLREQVRRIIKSTGVTTLLVTHDQEEALSMADRIGFMQDGRIRQVGVAEELFMQPLDISVAEFFGDSNILRYRATAPRTLSWPLGILSLPDGVSTVSLVISPDSVEITPQGVDGVVLDSQYFGHYRKIVVELRDGQRIHVRQTGLNYVATNIGDRVGLTLLRTPTIFTVD